MKINISKTKKRVKIETIIYSGVLPFTKKDFKDNILVVEGDFPIYSAIQVFNEKSIPCFIKKEENLVKITTPKPFKGYVIIGWNEERRIPLK